MKKNIKLTERDLTILVKRVISEDREVSIPGKDLSILISAASRFCRNQMGDRKLSLMPGSELEDKSGSNDCYRVELLNRQYVNI